jgi:hypothetical protein
MSLKNFLNESGPKSYYLALLQIINQLNDMEEQVNSLGSEINIATSQGLYKRNTVPVHLMSLSDDLVKVRMKAEAAAKEAKKLK